VLAEYKTHEKLTSASLTGATRATAVICKTAKCRAVIKAPVPRSIVSARRGYSCKHVDTCSAAFDSISVAAIGASAPGC
jgi:hypothetical protein